MTELLAALMGLVEGLTEFIPVSSTGHLILAGWLCGFEQAVGKEVADTFDVFIQLGAILAVVAAYPGRFVILADVRRRSGFAGIGGIALLALTTLPALVVGLLARKAIKAHLFNPTTVAIGLAAGAIWILSVEWRKPSNRSVGLDGLTWKHALGVGVFQCLALWPGVSRSAATILGGMLCGIDRKTATEYSFFAAVPVLTAAAIFDLYKSLPVLSWQHVPVFAVGTVVSFFSAWAAVRLLIRYVSRHTLTPFAWYRLVVALLVLVLLWGKTLGD
jgi:undecaprenyl-diphosphatase